MKERIKTAAKHVKHHSPYILLVIIVALGVIHYQNVIIRELNEELDVKLRGIRDDLTGFAVLYDNKLSSLDEKSSQIKTNLTVKIGSVETILDSVKEESERKLSSLEESIEEAEEKYNIQLNEVKKEIENINVQSADFTAIIDDVLPSVVSIITDVGKGSGVAIRSGGYIVTNMHVLNNAKQISVLTYSNKVYPTRVLAVETSVDLAVLKIDANIPHLNFGDSNNVKVGEKVIAAGNPGGLDFTVTEGIVSATNRVVSSNNVGYVQTDVPINPGNSGGPLINKQGEVIGINNFKIQGFEGLGFAIPSNAAKEISDLIIEQYG